MATYDRAKEWIVTLCHAESEITKKCNSGKGTVPKSLASLERKAIKTVLGMCLDRDPTTDEVDQVIKEIM